MSAGRRDSKTTSPSDPGPSRRGVLRGAAVAGLAVVTGVGLSVARRLRPPEDSRGGPGVLPPFITPIGSFYAFANGPWPAPLGTEAPLEVASGGVVKSIRWADVVGRPTRSVVRTLSCDGNGYISAEEGVGCDMAHVDPEMSAAHPPALHWNWRFGGIGNAEWATMTVAELFDALGVPTSGDWLHAAGRDGYRRSFPRDVALDSDFLVALGMNGEALPHAHGAPARLLVPGQYGAMNVKWVQSLRFGPRDEPSEAEGGAQTVYEVKPLAFATMPEDRAVVPEGPVELAGIAYAGKSAVQEVALWTGEQSWTAELIDRPEPYVWTRWRSVVQLPAGETSIRIACLARDGRQSVEQKAWGEAVGYGGLHTLRLSRG